MQHVYHGSLMAILTIIDTEVRNCSVSYDQAEGPGGCVYVCVGEVKVRGILG